MTITITKPIKSTNTEAVNAFLAEVQGRATARTVSADTLPRVVRDAERKLSALPKRLWRGATIDYTVSGPRASSYGYAAEATRVTLVRRSADWALTSAERVTVYPGTDERLKVSVPAETPLAEVFGALTARTGLIIEGADANALCIIGVIDTARRMFPQIGSYESAALATANYRAFLTHASELEAWAKALPDMSPGELIALAEHFGSRVDPSKLDADTIDVLMHLRGDGEVTTPALWEALIVGKREAKYAA
ncbi:hypothetical protein [Mycolicibacterium fortuitum]|uniref:hypothetical protein n=1 Tax=Mycolicibacterium fortuitum TaxID=1766 RepID=UPI001CDB8072|nr:hypothetical protein [Mycolicibacterium fortuitum]UBV14993.1 hypothetical protein H8Z57_30645 [Mycolicibacterium fortuitum]